MQAADPKEGQQMAEEREKKADTLEEGIEPEDVEAHVKAAAGEREAGGDQLDDDEVKAHVKLK